MGNVAVNISRVGAIGVFGSEQKNRRARVPCAAAIGLRFFCALSVNGKLPGQCKIVESIPWLRVGRPGYEVHQRDMIINVRVPFPR